MISIVESLTIEKVVTAVEPKWTTDAVVNPEPLIVTDCPPATGPILGLTLVTAGGEK